MSVYSACACMYSTCAKAHRCLASTLGVDDRAPITSVYQQIAKEPEAIEVDEEVFDKFLKLLAKSEDK